MLLLGFGKAFRVLFIKDDVIYIEGFYFFLLKIFTSCFIFFFNCFWQHSQYCTGGRRQKSLNSYASPMRESFSLIGYNMSSELFINIFIMLRKFPFMPNINKLVRSLIKTLNCENAVLYSYLFYLFFAILSVSILFHTDLCVLKHSCMPGINPTWSWGVDNKHVTWLNLLLFLFFH